MPFLRHMPSFLAALIAMLLLAGGDALAVQAGQEGGFGARPAGGTAQIAALAAPGAPAAQVLGARVGQHPDRTRFVLDLSAAVDFRVETNASRKRFLLLLSDAAWTPSNAPPAAGLLQTIAALRSARGVTIVLDTTVAARIASAELLPPRDGHGPRLIVDLVGAGTQPGSAAGVAAAGEPPTPPSTDLLARVRLALAVPGKAVAPLHPPTTPALQGVPIPRTKPPVREQPLIVLDAGHGGQDPGATAVVGAKEKDITLAMAKELRRQLLATGRYRVALTRDRDVFIRLRDRVAIARDKEADLFLSLHADSIGRPSIRGLSVYTLSQTASDREAEMLAQRENRADAIVGMDLSAENAQVVSILIDLARRDTANQSQRLAGKLLEELGRETPLLRSPLRAAGFAVLTAPDVPSVLLEMGYLSHPKDAKLLTTDAHRRKLAAGIVRAIDAYFGRTMVASRS